MRTSASPLSTAVRGTLTNILHRFLDRRRELGLTNALLLALNGGLRRLNQRLGVARYYLIAQPVGQPGRFGNQRARFDVREITRDAEALQALPRSAEQIRYRQTAGGICLGVFPREGGAMRGFIWLLFGPYQEDEHRCVLQPPPAPPCALDVDVYVFPEARGGLVFAELWRAADRALQERGIEWSLSRISAFNGSSLRAHQRLGARRIGSLYFLQLGHAELLFTGRRPFLALSRPRGPAPAITLHPPDRSS